MKRFILSMAMMLMVVFSASAMSYEQARDRALFLTDKMAYELNLNDEQYEAAYEVNLDYLMSINTYDDLYGTYWTRRNLDLSYILFDWQYSAFCSAAYFYRPLTWADGVWRFSIYARYPHRTYFYFGRPGFYATYHGGHSWHMNGGHSWYHGRDFGPRPGGDRFGMRDRFDRGDFNGTRNHGGRFDRNPGRPGRGDNNFRPGRGDNGNRPDNNGRPGRDDNRGNGNANRPDNGNYRGGNGNYRGGTSNRPTTTVGGQNDNSSRRPFSTSRRPDLKVNTNVGSPSRANTEFRQSSTRTTVSQSGPSYRQSSSPAPSRSSSSTFSPSRGSSSRSSFSGGSPSRGGSSFSSGSSSRGGGSFSGGGRSGGGGHVGGRR